MKRFLGLLVCFAAYATLVPALSVEALIDSSEVIAHGRVERSWPAWDNAHKYIWTHHEIAVLDSIRGTAARSVVVSEPGGEVDGVGMKVSGALPYGVGEEIVVFLYRTPVGYLRAVGYGQGKYSVTREGRVRASLSGFELTGRAHGTPLTALDGLTVSEFKARIRERAYPRK